ncbi:MAG: hypothetical protein V1856_01005 [Candidatus Liptonbacteria bacterium]
MMFEGDVVLYTTALLTQQGFLKMEWSLPLAILGLFWGDILWFEMGRRLPKEFFLRKWMNRLTEGVDEQLNGHPIRTLFITKFAYGMGHFAIMRIGTIANISLKEFLRRDFWASLPWFVIVWTLGYVTGTVLPHLRQYFKYAEIGIAAGIIILIATQHLARYEAKKISRKNNPG